MKWFVKENTWLKREIPIPDEESIFMDFGWGNGYALIPQTHPLFGKHYDIINEYVSVHYGLTWSALVDEKTITHWKLDPEDLGFWCVGFDTCHLEDNTNNWPQSRVEEEAQSLAEQLEEATLDISNNPEILAERVQREIDFWKSIRDDE